MLNGDGASAWEDEDALQVDGGDGCTDATVLNAADRPRVVTVMCCTLRIFDHNKRRRFIFTNPQVRKIKNKETTVGVNVRKSDAPSTCGVDVNAGKQEDACPHSLRRGERSLGPPQGHLRLSPPYLSFRDLGHTNARTPFPKAVVKPGGPRTLEVRGRPLERGRCGILHQPGQTQPSGRTASFQGPFPSSLPLLSRKVRACGPSFSILKPPDAHQGCPGLFSCFKNTPSSWGPRVVSLGGGPLWGFLSVEQQQVFPRRLSGHQQSSSALSHGCPLEAGRVPAEGVLPGQARDGNRGLQWKKPWVQITFLSLSLGFSHMSNTR